MDRHVTVRPTLPPPAVPGSPVRGGSHRRLGRGLAAAVVALALPATAGAVTGPAAENPESTVRLISPWAVAPAEGELWLGLELTTEPGWHVYWKNSGDAGYPPAISFEPTPEIVDAELHWPAPERYELPGDLESLGYEGEVIYPIRARLAAAGRERIEIAADLDYLVCEVDCVPYSYRLTLDQPLARSRAGDGREALEDPATAPRLSAWRDRLPAPPEAVGVTTRGALDLADPERPRLTVTVEGEAAAAAEGPELFLEAHELFSADAPSRKRTADGWSFSVPLGWRERPDQPPATVELAWTVTGLGAGGGAGAAIEVRRAIPATAAAPVPAVPAASWALGPAALALGAVAAVLAGLGCWGLLPIARRREPAGGAATPAGGGDRRAAGVLGFAALAAAVGLLYRLALALPSERLAAVELALLALALAAWARHRAGGAALRAALAVAMVLASAAAVGIAAGG